MQFNYDAKDGDNEELEDDADDELPSDIQPTIAPSISLARAYVLCVTLGIFGAHYYYMGRRTDGLLYTATLGFLGVGWIADWFRLPSLVEGVRKARREEAENGYSLFAVPFGQLEERSLVNAYIYSIPPWGFFGIHHMYLGTFRKNEIFYLIYIATFGFFGVGWLLDMFRIPTLVRRANKNILDLRSGKLVSSRTPDSLYLDTAYSLLFPLGIVGLHHFYLRRYFFGFIYMFTLGMAGVGVIMDIIRMPSIHRRNVKELKELKYTTYRLDDVYMLWFPLGLIGLHHFYLRHWKVGVAYLCTFGFLGIGWIIDAFRMRSLVDQANKQLNGDIVWDESLLQTKTKHNNMNMFVDSKLFTYPITDEDGNIQVYAFPLRPNGRPSWLLGWAWSPSSTNQNEYMADERSVLQVPRDLTQISDYLTEGAVGWSHDSHKPYELSIT